MDCKLRPPTFFTVTAEAVRNDPEMGRIICERLTAAEVAGVRAVLAQRVEQNEAGHVAQERRSNV